MDFINKNPSDIYISENNVIIDLNKFITIKTEYTNYINDIELVLKKIKIESQKITTIKNTELTNLFLKNKTPESNYLCDVCNLKFKSFKGLSIHQRKCKNPEKYKTKNTNKMVDNIQSTNNKVTENLNTKVNTPLDTLVYNKIKEEETDEDEEDEEEKDHEDEDENEDD